MKIRSNIYIISAIAVVLAACSKDLGNYKYQAINDFEIAAGQDTFYVNQFDTLRISPVIN